MADDSILAELWDAIMSLAEHRRAIPIRSLWVEKVPGWTIAVNGSKSDQAHEGFTVKPYNCAVWFGDWLAGSFSPFEGAIAAGSLANAESLIAAIRKEIGQ